MQRSCDTCRTSYDAKRPNSKYCSDLCRKRSARGSVTPSLSPVAPLAGDRGEGDAKVATLVSATRAELTAAGRLGSSLGQAAMLLARRLESEEVETGSSIAALVREHRAALAEATAGAVIVEDPLDQMAAARLARRSVV